MNIELKEDDIIFDDSVDIFENSNELIGYIKENDNLDKMFGIYNKDNHNEDYQINYYGVYNYENNNFYLNCCATIFCSCDELKEKYPDIYEELINIESKEKDIYLSEAYDFVFDKFKEYCLEDFKIHLSDCYDCSDFNALVQSIKKELENMEDIDVEMN